MAKATLTVIRKIKLEKPTGMGAARIVEALAVCSATGETIHASDLHLRKLSRLFLQPLSTDHCIYGASINTTTKLGGHASVSYFNVGTPVTGGDLKGTMARHTGVAANFYVLALGE